MVACVGFNPAQANPRFNAPPKPGEHVPYTREQFGPVLRREQAVIQAQKALLARSSNPYLRNLRKNGGLWKDLACEPHLIGEPKIPTYVGYVNHKSFWEGLVGKLLNQHRALRGLTRDPTGRSEFVDHAGVFWDIKAFGHVEGATEMIEAELRNGENVIADLTKLTDNEAKFLSMRISQMPWRDRVVIFNDPSVRELRQLAKTTDYATKIIGLKSTHNFRKEIDDSLPAPPR